MDCRLLLQLIELHCFPTLGSYIILVVLEACIIDILQLYEAANKKSTVIKNQESDKINTILSVK